ncbi:hypothetical protein [Legionella sp.]|uniref:hypothetical protein n=1 Tax=Legionella sp. TaxID=459 RepID=UPI003C8CF1BF
MPSEHKIKDIILIWVTNNSSFNFSEDYCPIFNSAKHPFLQNVIAHSSLDRNIHIIQVNLQKNTEIGKEIDKSFNKLENDCKVNKLNIKIYDFFELVKEDFKLLEFLQKNKLKFADIIDLVKIYIGANLHTLNISEAAIADFDCVIPSNLKVQTNHFDVLPLIEKSFSQVRFDFNNDIDHYIENGFFFVNGDKNLTCIKMLERAKNYEAPYFEKHQNDAIYRIFIAEILRTIDPAATGELEDDALFKKYAYRDKLEKHIEEELCQLDGLIQYERGHSWRGSKKESLYSMPVFKSGHFPVYPRELDHLHKLIFIPYAENKEKIIPFVDHLISKGFDVRSPIQWINLLEMKENVMFLFLDRYTKERPDENLSIFKWLINKGIPLDSRLLYCLLSTKDSPYYK